MARFPQHSKFASKSRNKAASEKSAQRLSEVLTDQGASQGSSLGGLLRRASLLAQLQNVLGASLHPDVADHMRVANVRDGRLILIAPSPVWATRLRMQAGQLLYALREAGLNDVDRVEVRVVPPSDWPSDWPSGDASESGPGPGSGHGKFES